ncbi:hypothetical protein VTK73DRAFT_9101 [Phialemonium thermophilum]|uniref:Alpha/beta hydrolase fold-3 domain-containing protein n=1 Tax=Phialemonium thermophilum TaxID=223376 RepID=A0ABR3XLK6_9PEZI
MATGDVDKQRNGSGASDGSALIKNEPPNIFFKIAYATHAYTVQGMLAPFTWIRDWKDYFSPPDGGPNIVKIYECRPHLPIRVFFPEEYDQTSPHTLPTLFTFSGGGFCIGSNRDDDEWNRNFADTQGVLVVSLNYSKSPQNPFPVALHDLEALVLAVLADESLPIDRVGTPQRHSGRSRTAFLGFSSGGNLALAVSQLPSIRDHLQAPRAAVSVYGILDLSGDPRTRVANRPFKPGLSRPRGASVDPLAHLLPTFFWSYIPYGHDLHDPLLSPVFARRADLPPYVGVVAAELDLLAHESWRLACRLAREGAEAEGREGRAVPDPASSDLRERICGRRGLAVRKGVLEGLGRAPVWSATSAGPDDRFAFETVWETGGSSEDGKGGVKWLLVPDVLHGFDNPNMRDVAGTPETIRDAKLKTHAYVAELGRWLKEVVWEF